MIPVPKAPEPEDFDERVRKKGLAAIAELVGEEPSSKRKGRKRRKVAATREQIPSDKFPPLWRDVLVDMHRLYEGRCAYLALYIEHGTGDASVDHFIPKSKHWDLVYEWSNYRLAAGTINSKKNDKEVDAAFDPFVVSPGLFALEFVGFQVKPGPAALGPMIEKVALAIIDVGLNKPECCKARQEYVEAYQRGCISFGYLQRRAPFVAQELVRQGQSRS